MSIAEQITRIKTNISSAYSKAEEKGATMPTVLNTDNLPATIESITGGGGSAIINQNEAGISPMYAWQGTEEEWNDSGESKDWYNWKSDTLSCYTDTTAPTTESTVYSEPATTLLKTVNADVTGSLDISQDVALSGFDTTSLIEYTKDIFKPSTSSSFEWFAKFKTSTLSGTQEIMCISNTVYFRTEGSYIQIRTFNDGTSRTARLSLSSDTLYYARVRYFPTTTTKDGYSYTGQYLYIELSTDNSTWTRASINTSGVMDLHDNYLNIGTQGVGGEIWIGTIYAEDCYIKIDDEYWWKGTKNASIESATTSAITLTDNREFDRNESGDTTTTKTIGEAHPDYLSFIDGVGIRIGTTDIADLGE